MDILVVGTGAADGWPNAFCRCASCTSQRTAGRLRGQSAVLVDDTLLLDCGPDTPAAAQRAGADLTGLRHVLITHAHPDHCSPAFLLFRSWIGDAPLDVVGPPEVIEACRMWVAPDSPVRFVTVRAGDRLELGRYKVAVLAARHGAPGTAVLYDVATDADRLLYATDTGPLPVETVEAVRGAAFGRVFMEETFGDLTGHGTDHLDLPSFAEQVRRLRDVGAVTADTDVVAVHLSHHNPPPAELSRRLADWGSRIVDDGTRLDRSPGTVPRSVSPSRRTLVIGGARSGKSREAERLLAAEEAVTYVATSYPRESYPGESYPGEGDDGEGDDPEWAERVRLHRERRPASWSTLETIDLAGLLESDGPPLLVDCLTLWLTRVMDVHECWDDQRWHATGEKAVQAEIESLVVAWRSTRRRLVAVTNEVGQGVVPSTAAGRRFRDLMGRLNAAVAAETEDVRWCVAGRVASL